MCWSYFVSPINTKIKFCSIFHVKWILLITKQCTKSIPTNDLFIVENQSNFQSGLLILKKTTNSNFSQLLFRPGFDLC